MSRIRKVYEARLRALLLRVHTRKLESGVRRLTAAAEQLSTRNKLPPARALISVYERTRGQIQRWERRTARVAAEPASVPKKFLCDAGLGGLARWLRASGYEALWFPGIDDAELLRKARELRGTVLTTDSLMMQRGVLRDGIIPALWLPPALTIQEQLTLVFREFNLTLQPPRCMRCGGELRRVARESVRDRIPPKTWHWIDDYFLCAGCGHLFWHGTHWQRISRELREHVGGPQ
jgi:uncharacterized protein with PIN domain